MLHIQWSLIQTQAFKSARSYKRKFLYKKVSQLPNKLNVTLKVIKKELRKEFKKRLGERLRKRLRKR
jgi:hypothetical protein